MLTPSNMPSSDCENNLAKQQRQSAVKKCKTCSGLGIFYAMLCSLSLATSSLLAKLISLHPIQISASRCIGQFLITYPILAICKRKSVDITGSQGLKKFLYLHGIAGSTGMIFLYLSIGQMSVGDAVSVSSIKSVLIGFFACLCLKEALTVIDVLFSVVSVIGVLLISKPSFMFPSQGDDNSQSPLGVLFALISAFLVTCGAIGIRRMGTKSYVLVNVLYYSAAGSVSTSILLIAMQEFTFPCVSELPYVFLIGLFGFLGQFFLVLSLQHERPAVIFVLRNVQIIMVYILQIVVLHDIPTLLSLIGASMIMLCGIGIGIRKVVNERKKRQEKEKNSP